MWRQDREFAVFDTSFGGELIHLVDMSPFFEKGDIFCNFLFAFLYTNPFWNEVDSERKECASLGVNSFLFE